METDRCANDYRQGADKSYDWRWHAKSRLGRGPDVTAINIRVGRRGQIAPRRQKPTFPQSLSLRHRGTGFQGPTSNPPPDLAARLQTESREETPPRQEFVFSWLHGIRWDDACAAPEFGAVWRKIWPFIDGVQFMAAHYAPFDRSVLEACCQASQMPTPRIPFCCTMRLARDMWGIYPTKLEDVCRYLGLPLTHHYA